jgi:hypothetical protein
MCHPNPEAWGLLWQAERLFYQCHSALLIIKSFTIFLLHQQWFGCGILIHKNTQLIFAFCQPTNRNGQIEQSISFASILLPHNSTAQVIQSQTNCSRLFQLQLQKCRLTGRVGREHTGAHQRYWQNAGERALVVDAVVDQCANGRQQCKQRITRAACSTSISMPTDRIDC